MIEFLENKQYFIFSVKKIYPSVICVINESSIIMKSKPTSDAHTFPYIRMNNVKWDCCVRLSNRKKGEMYSFLSYKTAIWAPQRVINRHLLVDIFNLYNNNLNH